MNLLSVTENYTICLTVRGKYSKKRKAKIKSKIMENVLEKIFQEKIDKSERLIKTE